MDRAEYVKIYLDHLTQEGYRPSLDDDGDIVFKAEGKTYLVMIDAEDPTFFRLIFPNFWPIENDEERALVYKTANLATSLTKVAKVFVVSDTNVWASVELFVDTPEQALPHFQRSMSAIKTAVASFANTMRKTLLN